MPTLPGFIPLAAALLFLPLLVGLGLGRLLHRAHRWVPRIAVAAAVVLSFPASGVVRLLGAWDVLWIGLVLGAGVLAGASHADRRDWLAGLAATLIGVAALEIAVRRWLPPAPSFPSPEGATFFMPPSVWDAGCTVLYGDAGVESALRGLHRNSPLPPRQREPLVVHLGDSMTFGDGVREDETFPALLDRLRPDIGHANYGVPGVGTDFEYLLLQKILATQRPALVVLHVYVGNDVYDIDRSYACARRGRCSTTPPMVRARAAPGHAGRFRWRCGWPARHPRTCCASPPRGRTPRGMPRPISRASRPGWTHHRISSPP